MHLSSLTYRIPPKAALAQFARYLALELGPRGSTVNIVEPGPVEDTRMSHVLDEKQKQRQMAATPLGRLANWNPGQLKQNRRSDRTTAARQSPPRDVVE